MYRLSRAAICRGWRVPLQEALQIQAQARSQALLRARQRAAWTGTLAAIAGRVMILRAAAAAVAASLATAVWAIATLFHLLLFQIVVARFSLVVHIFSVSVWTYVRWFACRVGLG